MSLDSCAVTLKYFQAPWILPESVHGSIQRPLHRYHATHLASWHRMPLPCQGWVLVHRELTSCKLRMDLGQVSKGKSVATPLICQRALASVLSRIRIAKNRPKEKAGDCCNVITETSQCKLSVTALDTERPEEEVRRKGFQEASS